MSDGGNNFRVWRGRVPPSSGHKSHPKDPRLIRPVSGSHNQSADVAQLVDTKEHLRDPNSFISQHDARSRFADRQLHLGLQNLPAQLTFAPFALDMSFVAGSNNPVLIVPHNTNRYGLIISYNPTPATKVPVNGVFAYSFGPPIFISPGTLSGLGVFMPPTIPFVHQYIGEVCPIDDIWVLTQSPNDGQFVVFEGTIALDANLT